VLPGGVGGEAATLAAPLLPTPQGRFGRHGAAAPLTGLLEGGGRLKKPLAFVVIDL
jgi:hypothetical protein